MRRLGFFQIEYKKILFILVIALVPLLSINMERKDNGNPWYLSPFSFAVSLTNYVYSDFSLAVRSTTSFYFDLINIKKRNLTLSKENAELRARLSQLAELNSENQRLNSLLGFTQSVNLNLTAAKVIGADLIADYDTLRINRGTKHGLKPFMAVIAEKGVVGYIFRPELNSSQVLLLTDRNSIIDAHNQRSRARGLVEGISRNLLRLTNMLKADDIAVGDAVVTSGLNNIFPKGIPIGAVTSVVKSNYRINQDVDIKPAVNPYNLEEVFIVLNTQPTSTALPTKMPSKVVK